MIWSFVLLQFLQGALSYQLSSTASKDRDSGIVMNGYYSDDFLGYSVSNVGDVNGDGVPDVAFGAPQSSYGECYVIFGGMSSGTVNKYSLTGSNGFTLEGSAGFVCSSVSGVGDVNGDGFDDLIVGAYEADVMAGASYVVFGARTSFSSSIYLNNLDGTDGFQLDGYQSNDYSGFSVSGAGDVNGDGVDDLIIGAYGASVQNADYSTIEGAGKSYVVFGKYNLGTSGTMELTSISGTNFSNTGFFINGATGMEYSGYSVSNAGDFNGDGFDDIIVGSHNSNNGNSYVIFGKSGNPGGGNGLIDVSSLDGEKGIIIKGVNGAFSGGAVSNAGDVNGDGYDDVIIGAAFSNVNGEHSGEAFIVFGGADITSVNLNSLDGSNGFSIQGENVADYAGSDVSGVGDINGDGYDDMLIGAPYADVKGMKDAGITYLLYGGSSIGSSGKLTLGPDINGVLMYGSSAYDYSGCAVAGGSDFNNDGVPDILIGAYGNENSRGKAYIIWDLDAHTSSSNNWKDTTLILLSCGAAVLLLVCCCCVVYRRSAKKESNTDVFAVLLEGEDEATYTKMQDDMQYQPVQDTRAAEAVEAVVEECMVEAEPVQNATLAT